MQYFACVLNKDEVYNMLMKKLNYQYCCELFHLLNSVVMIVLSLRRNIISKNFMLWMESIFEGSSKWWEYVHTVGISGMLLD